MHRWGGLSLKVATTSADGGCWASPTMTASAVTDGSAACTQAVCVSVLNRECSARADAAESKPTLSHYKPRQQKESTVATNIARACAGRTCNFHGLRETPALQQAFSNWQAIFLVAQWRWQQRGLRGGKAQQQQH